jgi:Uma2 family endonuclease
MTNISIDRLPIPADVNDLSSFRTWFYTLGDSGRIRASYLAGEIDIDMSPEEIHSHSKLKFAVYLGLGRFNEQRDLGEIIPDGARFINKTADLSTGPDLMFVSWESLRDGRAEYTEFVVGSERFIEVTGSPDLVVEVVSQSSVRKDTVKLRERYFAAGVREYWLLDGRGDTLRFQVLTAGPSEFEPVEPEADGFCRSPVLQHYFQAWRGRNPMGRPRFALRDRD